jgi:hypothetical protein
MYSRAHELRDGSASEGSASEGSAGGTTCHDVDGDGHGEGCAAGNDCDETDATAWQSITGYRDDDGDGVSVAKQLCTAGRLPGGYTESAAAVGDCNDSDKLVFPGNPERCSDGLDSDCDASTECPIVCGIDTFTYAKSCAGAAVFAGAKPAVYWPMDAVSGTAPESFVADSSGAGLNGTVLGGFSLRSDGAVVGSAGAFNGADAALVNQDFAGSVAFTIAAWASPASLQASDTRVIVDIRTGPEGFTGQGILMTPAGHFALFSEDGTSTGGRFTEGTSSVCLGKWHHVVASYGDKVARVYVNGVLETEASLDYTPAYGSSPLTVGRMTYNLSRYFDGRIDEVAIWKAALSNDEVKQLFNDGMCRRSFLAAP